MRKIINIFISLLLIFLPLLSYASDNMDSVFVSAVVEGPVQQVGIVINEVSMDSGPDWVELYNSGTEAVDIQGWTIDDVDASLPIEITESVSIPAGAYLVIYIKADGTNDLDFSNGAGSYYAGLSPTVSLAVTEDEVALYNSATQDSSTIVDFVSYCSDGSYGGDANGDQAHAVDAGIWTAGTYFNFTDTGNGYSIGLTADGSDTNSTADWSFYDTPSPGAENSIAPIVIDAPVITLPSEDYDGNYTVTWNVVSEATIYQLQEDTVDTFDSVNNQEFWPGGTFENITGRTDGTYYYRVRAWTAPPENGGISSDWSATKSITVSTGGSE